jgi:hypothetical protein
MTTAQNTTINLSTEDPFYISQADEDRILRDHIKEGKFDFDMLDAFTRRLDHEEIPKVQPYDVRFVYAIRVRGTNRVRIGFSKDPLQHLVPLLTAYPGLLELELIMRTREYKALESALYHKHRGRRISRSWFCFEENTNFLTEM